MLAATGGDQRSILRHGIVRRRTGTYFPSQNSVSVSALVLRKLEPVLPGSKPGRAGAKFSPHSALDKQQQQQRGMDGKGSHEADEQRRATPNWLFCWEVLTLISCVFLLSWRKEYMLSSPDATTYHGARRRPCMESTTPGRASRTTQRWCLLSCSFSE